MWPHRVFISSFVIKKGVAFPLQDIALDKSFLAMHPMSPFLVPEPMFLVRCMGTQKNQNTAKTFRPHPATHEPWNMRENTCRNFWEIFFKGSKITTFVCFHASPVVRFAYAWRPSGLQDSSHSRSNLGYYCLDWQAEEKQLLFSWICSSIWMWTQPTLFLAQFHSVILWTLSYWALCIWQNVY